MQIYKITNLATGLSYIGKTQDDNPYYKGSGILIWNSYRKRFQNDSLNCNRKSCHKWVYEQNEILHYYTKEILATCDSAEQLCELEKYYIQQYNTIRPNGYNIASGGDGGNLVAGYTPEEKELLHLRISEQTTAAMNNPEVRQRFLNAIRHKDDVWIRHISESLKGHKGHLMSDENKDKLRERMLGNQYGIGNRSRTGYINSDEMNQKISDTQKTIIHTHEWNQHVSEALKGRKLSEEHKVALRKPKPRYKWLLPDGSIRIMSASNGSRHDGWVRLEQIESETITNKTD